MYFYRLNANCQPDMVIENYSSLVWTERYRPAGDFELQTPDIEKMMATLPLGSLVSQQDTLEVMIVETYTITNNGDSDILKVSGRSLSTILEARAAVSGNLPLNNYSWAFTNYPSALAGAIIQTQIIDGVNDVKDIIPRVYRTSNIHKTEVNSYHIISRGNLYDAVMELLEDGDLGMRCERATTGSSYDFGFTIYDGVDKTSSVVLLADNGDFRMKQYVSSIKGSVDTVYGASPNVFSKLSRSGTSSFTGLKRRVGLNDCSDIKASTTAIETQMLASRNRSYLTRTTPLTAFECEVSPDIPFKYKTDYYLGDKVKCIGKYNIVQSPMVVEYIRVEDENGDRAYPTLALPSS